jgi:FAD/FMN-containing dehydrogenase
MSTALVTRSTEQAGSLEAARPRPGRSTASAAAQLRRRVTGAVHVSGSAGYDEHRKPLLPTLDPRPAAVVEADSAADVRAALDVSRMHSLPFAVQSTGHGTYVPSDGGVLVKTSSMASVLVDPDRRIARVGPGARWSAVLAAAGPFGLAPLSGSSPSVGVTGYTLGGGVGWLSRKYGFAADSVLRAEVVTADGRIVTASPTRNADLFWALRGGGGNFGVVTKLEFRLYEVPQVYAGAAYFSAERAGETIARYTEWAATAPDELSTAVLLRRMPDTEDVPAPVRGKRVLVVKAMYAGSTANGPAAQLDARRLLRPLWKIAGRPLLDEMRPMAYAEAAMGGTAARYLDLFRELPSPAIDALVRSEASNVEIRHWGGAMARGDGPAAHRTMPFSVIVDAVEPDVVDALRPYGNGGSFLNFLNDTTRTAAAFTPANYTSLRRIKAAYDPENVFRINHNIKPAR